MSPIHSPVSNPVVQEIRDATSIADVELQRQLQSLACAKFKILRKHPPGRDVHPDDSFSFNHEFASPMQKIKIGTVASKVESTDQRRETMERVDEERKHHLEVRGTCSVREGHGDVGNRRVLCE